ncbi:hypothetical protein R6242_09705 [Iodobacter sp. CM08]|uniref:hypothetical protein n=1 Tax=Iodobacter sp. CM08 TaxID=3085902 RepID=UPI002981D78F|nr:hypothetical protein [Iodobacter sp. CM08]MDW5416839.1 hypothetical protein [Iodobacter sp. CM08]
MKKNTICLITFALAACGGGGGNDSPTPHTTVSSKYIAYHYAATDSQTSSAQLSDYGAGISSPILPKGSFTYASNGTYSWGNGLSGGSGVYQLPENPHLPFAAMLCEPGLGGVQDKKATYVLVAANAIKVTSALDLAGQNFTTSVSDCQDDSQTERLSFDAQGNMSRTTFHYPNSTGVTTIYSPADFTQMQTGLNIVSANTRLHAFKLIADGKTRYLLVEQNKSLNGDGKDSIYLWKQ